MSCGCGRDVRYAFHERACIECGAGCCPTCAVHLESATHCQACAGALLGAPVVQPARQFDLH